MKFLQTLWTGPSRALKQHPMNMKAGWLSAEYHWMSWALSCLQAKNVFGDISLVTDTTGKEILIDQLNLPYSSVSTALQHTLNDYHPALFALAKIYTYSAQTGHFLHLDSDVFIWDKPDDSFLNSRLIAQNTDKNLPFYAHALNAINEHFTYIPPHFLKQNYEHTDIYASNAGLLGGNDEAFFKEYSRLAFEFIDKNKSNLDKLNTGSLNFIIEQYLFYELARAKNIPITYLKGVVDDPVFKDYIKFEDFPHVDLVHPVGGFKKQPHVCEHVAKKLRNDYPEYYYRVIDAVRSVNDRMLSSIYYLPSYRPGIVPPFIVEEGTKPLESRQSFERTTAAINYLNKKYLVDFPTTFEPGLTKRKLKNRLKKLPFSDNEKDCLLEIFGLEWEITRMLNKLYATERDICRLYNQDLNGYLKIQETFSLPNDVMMEVKITIAENLQQVSLQYDWNYNNAEEVEALIERNFNAETADYTAVLISRPIQLNIREYYTDELDNILIYTLNDIFSIRELIKKMEPYFSPEEISGDYESFKLLITKTIKQLMYCGIVKIIF